MTATPRSTAVPAPARMRTLQGVPVRGDAWNIPMKRLLELLDLLEPLKALQGSFAVAIESTPATVGHVTALRRVVAVEARPGGSDSE